MPPSVYCTPLKRRRLFSLENYQNPFYKSQYKELLLCVIEGHQTYTFLKTMRFNVLFFLPLQHTLGSASHPWAPPAGVESDKKCGSCHHSRRTARVDPPRHLGRTPGTGRGQSESKTHVIEVWLHAILVTEKAMVIIRQPNIKHGGVILTKLTSSVSFRGLILMANAWALRWRCLLLYPSSKKQIGCQ